MSCISKIKHAYASFNQNQRKIADYILTHPQDIIRMSVQELAKKSETSPAAIVRFSKKVGYDGYPSLKIELASEIHAKEDSFIEDRPSLSGSFSNFLLQEQRAYLNTVRKTFDLINADTLETVIDYATNARRIFLTGIGASSNICTDLLVKLTRIDAPAVYYIDAHVQLANSIHLTPDDLVIAVSYRGNTNEVNTIVQRARKRNIKTVAITQNNGSQLSNLAEIVLPVPSEENEFRLGAITSRNSTQIITDLIYLGMIKNEVEKSSQDLIESRKAIYELHQK